MEKILISLSMAFLSTVFSCNSVNPPEPTSENTDTLLPPVETKNPNTQYPPAFEGQTRIHGVKTKANYTARVIASGLDRPWGITSLPDGRLLITQKSGTMKIVTTNGEVGANIGGLPAVHNAGQGGLLDVAIDPDFRNNRMVYFTFAQKSGNGNLTAVGKGKLSADESHFENVSIIYQATPEHNSNLHYGSRILVDAHGNLIISTGERSDLETRPQAQQLNSALGKILRITKEGKPAPGNPFLNNPNARGEIYSYGHRNVQGLAFHPETGDLWESEMGPMGGDEINRIVPGKNYGWPTITYGLEYSGAKVGPGIQVKEGMEQPVYYWDPVISPSGITFYSNGAIAEWKNNLFVAALSGMHIDRLIIHNNKVVGEERLVEKERERFRDITEGKDGALYAITDSGKLYRIGL